MNYKVLFLAFTMQLSLQVNAQTLSTNVRQDFCKNAVLNYEYGTNMFRAWMIQSARSIGINEPYEINQAVRNIIKNQKLQEEFFKIVNRFGGDKNFKVQQFTSIGMTYQHSVILVDYINVKYNSNVVSGNENNEVFDENPQITLCKVLKKETWIYNKRSFKSTIESQRSRVRKLLNGTLVNVVIDWEEEPGEMVKVIYKDIKGYKKTGYVKTSSLEFLNAG